MLGGDPANDRVKLAPHLDAARLGVGEGVVLLQHDDFRVGRYLLQGRQDVVKVLADVLQDMVVSDAGRIQIAVVGVEQVTHPDRQGDRADLASVGPQERYRSVQLRAGVVDMQSQPEPGGEPAAAIDHGVGRLRRAGKGSRPAGRAGCDAYDGRSRRCSRC
jgi:hypothetical protein